jgi:hypothetical protein
LAASLKRKGKVDKYRSAEDVEHIPRNFTDAAVQWHLTVHQSREYPLLQVGRHSKNARRPEEEMNTHSVQKSFLRAAQNDGRIKPLHMSLFMEICWGGTPDKKYGRLTNYRKDIMPLARMGSCATYYEFLNELVEYGYLKYWLSNNYYSGSKVSFPKT